MSHQRSLIARPEWLARLESSIARRVDLHPNTISAFKLLVVAPALLLSLKQVSDAPGGALWISALFATFAALDYLDGVVARGRGLETAFGRVFDRVTDYPLLIALSFFCVDIVPVELLSLKLGIDVLLLVLYTMGLGSTQNRLRTALSYSALFSLLALSQGWLPQIFRADTVSWLLAINIALSAIVALYNLRVLQKRFVADALSFGNLSCGVLAMIAGSRGDYVISLALLLLGATLDGFDGAAARRWGSTRWGVYSDDVADGVNFGLAPGALLYFAIGGASGIVLGVSYSLFTISRLVFFTLDKEGSDPAYFAGVPSTVGGIITVCSVILFRHQPALLGMMVGLACAQMVSFDTAHKHLGRAIARHNKLLFALPAAVAALIATAVLAGPSVAVIIVLAASVLYAMVPVARSFKNVLQRREAS